MCGRFTLTVNPEVVQLAFALESVPASYAPRYNIAPTQPVLALTNEGHRRATMLRWGLIPAWAKDPAIGNSLINARSETLAEKPAFRHAFRRRRCVIFADGFYEWQRLPDGRRRPMYIRLASGEPFALAGLWEVWQPSHSDEALRTCTIVTTRPNAFMAPIHTRMPVILDRAVVDDWLTPGDVDPLELMPLLAPLETLPLTAYEVSKAVNSPHTDVPDLIRPLPASPPPDRLL